MDLAPSCATSREAAFRQHLYLSSRRSSSTVRDDSGVRSSEDTLKTRQTSSSCARNNSSSIRVMKRGKKIAPSLLLVALVGLVATAHVPLGVTASSSLELISLQECSSCDVPAESHVPFCAEYVKYSSCRTKSSWGQMDAAAEEEFFRLLTASNVSSVSSDDSCLTALKHVECAKIFNVCELGAPQNFCLDSCTVTIATNCTSLLSTDSLSAAKTNFCGDEKAKSSLVGIANGGKCFEVDYVGPKHTAWIVGFVIAVVFSFFASVGINLQKKALKQNELTAQEQSAEPTPVYRLPLWCLGFFLILAGSVLDFVAFGLAPQSLLAPLAALTLVWNMMLAPCFNKEKLGRKDIAATLVIFTGATIAVVFASHTSPSYNLSMLMELYRDPLTCAYFVVVFLCVALHYSLIQLVEKFSLTSKRHRMIQIGQPAFWARVRLVAYSGLSGTMGGQSVLFAKSCAELLKAAFHGDSCLKHVETYLLALALIGCLLCQIHYLNCGLVHYDALSVVPIYQAYWIITGVLGGVIYFQEIRTFSVQQAVMFVLGIMTTIFGVVLLSQRKPAHPPSHSKRKILERGFSFTSTPEGRSDSLKGHLPTVPEMPITEGTAESEEAAVTASASSMATINENESEMSTGEESDEDDGSGNAGGESDQVSRHVIDNYLDMSATMGFAEILGGLGFQTAASQRGIFSRRPSSRITGDGGSARPQRRSVDDIEVGMPAATRQANPREKVAKRRSITFTSFQNAKKDDQPSPPPPPPPPQPPATI